MFAIVFLVECNKSDNSTITDFFSDWGYDNTLIINNNDLEDSSRNKLSAISYILKNNGKIVTLTNPSLGKTFHREMNKHINSGH